MKKTIINKIFKAVVSLGPFGNLPASGTWGSLVALPFAWWLAGSAELVILAFISLLIGTLLLPKVIEDQANKDPSFVIIDEFMGQLITFFCIPKDSMSPVLLVFGFLFFRTFDILKPWPASYFDRKVHTGLGIMMDDFAAALYAMFFLAFCLTISYNF